MILARIVESSLRNNLASACVASNSARKASLRAVRRIRMPCRARQSITSSTFARRLQNRSQGPLKMTMLWNKTIKSWRTVSSDRRLTVSFCALIGVLVLTHVSMRAARLSITHDEALTYLWHVTGSWREIISLRTPGLPDNNHLLFTLLAKVSISALGVSEFALRLPSVIGAGLFLTGVYMLLSRMVAGWWLPLAMVAVSINPYVVDFLGLARGYGLGLGLMALALALILSPTDHENRSGSFGPLVGVWLLAAAVIANFTYLLVLVPVTLLLTVSKMRSWMHETRPARPERARGQLGHYPAYR